MKVIPVPVLLDNYAYLVLSDSRDCAVVDPAEARPVLEAAEREGATLRAIWNTHHHWDHVGGNRDLLIAKPKIEVCGFAGDQERIPGLTRPVEDEAEFQLGDLAVRVIFIPAHTSGHVAYHLPAEKAVFTGDTLFAGGCGRLFEGDAATMLASLERLASLPRETRVYCGHEYTEKNLQFALGLEPGNRALRERIERVKAARSRGEPTVPSTIAEELETNPFLRTRAPEIQRSIQERFPGTPADPASIFARARELKDAF